MQQTSDAGNKCRGSRGRPQTSCCRAGEISHKTATVAANLGVPVSPADAGWTHCKDALQLGAHAPCIATDHAAGAAFATSGASAQLQPSAVFSRRYLECDGLCQERTGTPGAGPQKIQVDVGGNKARAPFTHQPKPKPASLLHANLILHHPALVQPLLLLLLPCLHGTDPAFAAITTRRPTHTDSFCLKPYVRASIKMPQSSLPLRRRASQGGATSLAWV